MRIVAALCCLVLLAGCGQQADPNSPGPQPPPSSAPSTSEPVESPAGGTMTLRGKVEQGVEAGCMVLHTDDGDYLLFGAPATKAQAGAEVEVTGRIATDVASICQQGEPFVVESIRTVG